jgi:hypothetical protein
MEQLIISHILHGKFQENTSEYERGTMERMTSLTFEIVVDFKKEFLPGGSLQYFAKEP